MTSVWRRLTASRAEQEAEELQRETSDACRAICDCMPGDSVMVSGTVRSLTVRPKTQVPALEIELYDGTGRVRVVWLGRRRIPGIDPGRRLTVTGRLTALDGVSTIYNPRYELQPAKA